MCPAPSAAVPGESGLARTVAGAALVLVLGAAVRLATVDDVLPGSGVRLLEDTDPHYHVLRAERMLRGAPGAPWRDPALSWPEGAEILWPPAFDAAIAGLARLGSPRPEREDLALAAAILPVLFGLGSLLVTAALARRLGAGGGWTAAAIVAVLPAHVDYTVFGRGDQHAAEILLCGAELLAFQVAVRAPRLRRFAWACGAMAGLVALSAWTWMGSALFLVTPAIFTAAWNVLAPEPDEPARRAPAALLAGAGGGAALLAASIAVLGPPGALARFTVRSAGGLHVAAAAGVAAFGGVLLALRRARRGPSSAARRAVEVLLAAALPAAALLLTSASLRDGIGAALTAAGGQGRWYDMIEEYQPLLSSEMGSVQQGLVAIFFGFGLVIPAAIGGGIALARRWREDPGQRPGIVLLAAWGVFFVSLMFAVRRFGLYASVPLGIGAAIGLREAAVAARRWRGGRLGAAVLVFGALLVVGPTVQRHLQGWSPGVSDDELEALVALRDLPVAPGREGVLAPWSLGHAIQYHAARPVLVSPFGTDVGASAMEDWGAFWYAPGPAEAEAVLARRRIGLVLMGNPLRESFHMQRFAPAGTPELREEGHDDPGLSPRPSDAYARLVPARLFFGDGDGLQGFRLLFEGRAASARRGRRERLEIFGAVPGARLEASGAVPGVAVRAQGSMRTNQGRRFAWAAEAVADANGRATLRLPYATGMNGTVEAGPWTVTDGSGAATLAVAEDDVLRGAAVAVRLEAAAATAR